MKLFLPLSWLFACIMMVRNKLFDWRVLNTEQVGVPVISVGNLTMGGTGKTPLVEYIVRFLHARQRRVAVVSRGYNRTTSGVVVVSDGKKLYVDARRGGDEPVQIASKFRNAIVVVGERRVDAARKAVALGADVVVADDCFQHRYLKRDLDIVVLDATKPLAHDAVIPAGRMREPLSALRRAHLVALSNVDRTVLSHVDIETMLAGPVRCPCVQYRYAVTGTRSVQDDAPVPLDALREMNLIAFSGIGNHAAFVRRLQQIGCTLFGDMRFRDHHHYTDRDADALAGFAAAKQSGACITTEKDAVRLRSNPEVVQQLLLRVKIYYVTIEVEFLGGTETLHSLIDHCLQGSKDNANRDY
jgi:tetraacyldisaccharide 4'-kinase